MKRAMFRNISAARSGTPAASPFSSSNVDILVISTFGIDGLEFGFRLCNDLKGTVSGKCVWMCRAKSKFRESLPPSKSVDDRLQSDHRHVYVDLSASSKSFRRMATWLSSADLFINLPKCLWTLCIVSFGPQYKEGEFDSRAKRRGERSG